MKKLVYDWSDADILASVIQKLQIEKFIVAPSDTVLGLLAKASQGGFDALRVVKERENKPFLVLAPDGQAAEALCAHIQSDAIKKLLLACWPGPLTVVCQARATVPPYLCSQAGTVAVRVPHHAILQQIMQSIGLLLSTSANKPGQPVPAHIEEVDQDIQRMAAMVIAGHSGDQPSTILDITGTTPRIVREGVYTRSQLEELYGGPLL